MKPAPHNLPAFTGDKNLAGLHGMKEIQYIWDYYKLPLVILCIVLYAVGYIIYGRITHKDTVLYTALVNVNAGEALSENLGNGFLDYLNLNPSKNKVELYTGLYLTDDETNEYHEYTYASRMKIQATIDGELMDVVLMNKEAFDAFSQSGYLYDLEKLLREEDPGLYSLLSSDLEKNIVILEDNSMDMLFDTSLTYSAKTEESFYGIDLSRTELIRQAGFGEPVYLGIIANSPRTDTALAYLHYLFNHSMIKSAFSSTGFVPSIRITGHFKDRI